MARCFPFPPPGYCVKVVPEEHALIDSIKSKLQREKEKAEAEAERRGEKKEKKREEKERKREKKERKREEKRKREEEKKRQGEKLLQSRDTGFGEKAYNGLPNLVEPKYVGEVGTEKSAEVLERSDLTEERELPVILQQPSHSSESTDTSNKRKRDASPTPSGTSGQGNIIRFRLPLQKNKENNSREHDSRTECQPSISGWRADLPVTNAHAPALSRTECQPSISGGKAVLPMTNAHALPLSRTRNQPSISGGRTAIPVTNPQAPSLPQARPVVSSTPGTVETVAKKVAHISSHDRKLQRRNQEYEDLFKNWALPVELQTKLSDPLDDDWLFERKHQAGEKRLKTSSDVSSCGISFALQPRAQFMPEVDIYALPYTVPF